MKYTSKKYHIVGTVPKSRNRDKIDTPNIQVHDRFKVPEGSHNQSISDIINLLVFKFFFWIPSLKEINLS